LGDLARLIDVLEAVKAAVLVAEGGAHPGAGVLGGAAGESGGGVVVAVAGVVEDLEAAFGVGGAGAVVGGGAKDCLHLGSRGDEFVGGGCDGGMDDLERGGVGREFGGEGGVALGGEARGIAGLVNLHGGGGVGVEVEEEEEGEEEEGRHGEEEKEEGGSEDCEWEEGGNGFSGFSHGGLR